MLTWKKVKNNILEFVIKYDLKSVFFVILQMIVVVGLLLLIAYCSFKVLLGYADILRLTFESLH